MARVSKGRVVLVAGADGDDVPGMVIKVWADHEVDVRTLGEPMRYLSSIRFDDKRPDVVEPDRSCWYPPRA